MKAALLVFLVVVLTTLASIWGADARRLDYKVERFLGGRGMVRKDVSTSCGGDTARAVETDANGGASTASCSPPRDDYYSYILHHDEAPESHHMCINLVHPELKECVSRP